MRVGFVILAFLILPIRADELLVKGVDALLSDTNADAGSYKRGDIIEIGTDGRHWGSAQFPNFLVIKVPGVNLSAKISVWCVSAYNGTNTNQLVAIRNVKLDVDNALLPLSNRTAILTTGITTMDTNTLNTFAVTKTNLSVGTNVVVVH